MDIIVALKLLALFVLLFVCVVFNSFLCICWWQNVMDLNWWYDLLLILLITVICAGLGIFSIMLFFKLSFLII